MKTITYILCLSALMMLSSCDKYEEIPTNVLGMRPEYISNEEASNIKVEPARSFGKLGAISEKGKYLYIVEKLKGVHVLDNTNPNKPVNIAFWSIPGCVGITLSGNRLYAQNTKNLLVIEIISVQEIKLIDTEEDVYSASSIGTVRPPIEYNGFFECVDLSKGIVIGWKRERLKEALCRTF